MPRIEVPLYFTSEEGVFCIVAAGAEFKQVASNEMEESCRNPSSAPLHHRIQKAREVKF